MYGQFSCLCAMASQLFHQAIVKLISCFSHLSNQVDLPLQRMLFSSTGQGLLFGLARQIIQMFISCLSIQPVLPLQSYPCRVQAHCLQRRRFCERHHFSALPSHWPCACGELSPAPWSTPSSLSIATCTCSDEEACTTANVSLGQLNYDQSKSN